MDETVIVVGAGGLGCAVLPSLARLGRPIRVYDDDRVSLGNLQRQILFATADVGRPKAEVAAERVLALVPGARIEARVERLGVANLPAVLAEAALVVDGSDNFPTRFLVNDACVLAGVPLVHGGILRFTGQVMTVLPGRTACYRCLFEDLPPAGAVPSCAEAGVLGALCGIVGARMVEEARAILEGRPRGDALWVHDARNHRSRIVPLHRDLECAVCGEAPTIERLEAARYVEVRAA
ncbi:MAG TPA: HesA/MoeB/ThiF family protein [Fredinandcohnia sp.]|nr:HesA/MoeB/ThiF family protein [Fredinandcohnia sp.]